MVFLGQCIVCCSVYTYNNSVPTCAYSKSHAWQQSSSIPVYILNGQVLTYVHISCFFMDVKHLDSYIRCIAVAFPYVCITSQQQAPCQCVLQYPLHVRISVTLLHACAAEASFHVCSVGEFLHNSRVVAPLQVCAIVLFLYYVQQSFYRYKQQWSTCVCTAVAFRYTMHICEAVRAHEYGCSFCKEIWQQQLPSCQQPSGIFKLLPFILWPPLKIFFFFGFSFSVSTKFNETFLNIS